MDKFLIKGPIKLHGEIKVSGSKNSALPILFASILTEKPVEIYNVPKIQDIDNAIKIMIKLGIKVKVTNKIFIDASNISIYKAKCKLVKNIRASIFILGSLLARLGKVELSFPGGCAIGNRSIDLHINNLRKLGAKIILENNYIKAYVKDKLRSNHIIMNKISVGATLNTMIAATLAQGITIIENAAKEPEIIDTSNFLKTIGAKIFGAGTNKIIIIGVRKLRGGSYSILPDRIETGTFLVAAAASRSYIMCYSTQPKILYSVIMKLREAGAEINFGNDWIYLNMHGKRPKAVNLKTAPYPGFPTDMQSQFSILNIIANGISKIQENIFENRFMHIPELIKMGAKVKIRKNNLICHGVKKLFGTQVVATDLRAAISLVIAGCIAEGTTTIKKIYHIDRGYDNVEFKFKRIGAQIERTSDV